MNILYVEDDEIDQLYFKKLVKSQNFPIDFRIVDSVNEAKQAIENKERFDIVISDFYLKDGTANDVLKMVHDDFVIIAGDEHLVENKKINNNNIEFVAKPFPNDLLTKYLKYNFICLRYFNELTESDFDFKNDLTETALQTIPKSIEIIKAAVEAKDMQAIKFELHKLKTVIKVFGINASEELSQLEKYANENNENAYFELVKTTIPLLEDGVEQIKKLNNVVKAN